MLTLLAALAALAGLLVYETSKAPAKNPPKDGEPPRGEGVEDNGLPPLPLTTKEGLTPPDAVTTRMPADYFRGDEPSVKASLDHILSDPLSSFTSKSLPVGYVVSKVVGADAPIAGGERVVAEIVDEANSGAGAIEGIFSGPADPDEGPAVVLVDRVALQRSTPFEVPGKYVVPPSSKHSFHDRLRRARWEIRDPSEQGLKTFEAAPSLDPGDKVTLLLRDDFGTFVIGIAQVRELLGDGRARFLLLSPYMTVHDEGKGNVAFSRVLSQGLVDGKISQLVDPKSIKKA